MEETYHNLSEEKKQRLKEYQRSYCEANETSFKDVKDQFLKDKTVF